VLDETAATNLHDDWSAVASSGRGSVWWEVITVIIAFWRNT